MEQQSAKSNSESDDEQVPDEDDEVATLNSTVDKQPSKKKSL